MRQSNLIFLADTTDKDLNKLKTLIKSIKPASAIWVVYPKGRKEITEFPPPSAAEALFPAPRYTPYSRRFGPDMRLRTVPVFLAFLAMGFADAVGPFVSLAKNEFQLSNTVASLIPFAGFVMFGLLSIPMGVFQDKHGKKFVLMLGLVVAFVGLLNAAFGLTSFARFLITVVMMGAGAAILQVSGNPIMRDVSDEGKYARNLSLAQFVKAIGSLSGPVIPVVAAKYFGVSWKVIFPIYAVALAVAVVAVLGLHVKEKKSEHRAATLASCLELLSNGYVLMMVAAIFLYVGAEVSVSAGIPLSLKERFNMPVDKVGLLGTGLFFAALTIGRFSGGVILTWIAPRKFFLVTCALSVLAMLGMFLPDRNVAIASFFVAGLGFANIFPLVFAIAVEAMPEHTNELSGLMVTAILGGACLPPLMGLVVDHVSAQLRFVVPLAAILYITWTALANRSAAAARA